MDRKLDKYVKRDLGSNNKECRDGKTIYTNKGRFGRPRKYSDSLISSLVHMKNYFDLTLREAAALVTMMFGPEFAPDPDTI